MLERKQPVQMIGHYYPSDAMNAPCIMFGFQRSGDAPS